MSLSSRAKLVAIGWPLVIALSGGAQAKSTSCAAIARHLADLVGSDWSPADENANMVSLVLRKSPQALVPGRVRFRLAEYSRQNFTRAVARLPKPFTPSGELSRALDDLQGAMTVFELPGTDMLAANTIEGTAACNSTIFFSTRGGVAQLVQSPRQWEDDVGGSCGLTRSFASVDGMPLIIDDMASGPGLTSILTLTPWDKGKWQEPCTASFGFAPRFDAAKTLNDWPNLDNWEANDCGADGCAKLQRAALELVEETQRVRTGAEDRLRAAMTEPQRTEYQRLKGAAHPPDTAALPADGEDAGKPRTAAELTEGDPLLLPVVVDGRVLLASVGHFTIGWRVFADWKVTFEAAEADKTREIARFAIGMTPGPITSATVK